jgi:hypothetical protein
MALTLLLTLRLAAAATGVTCAADVSVSVEGRKILLGN